MKNFEFNENEYFETSSQRVESPLERATFCGDFKQQEDNNRIVEIRRYLDSLPSSKPYHEQLGFGDQEDEEVWIERTSTMKKRDLLLTCPDIFYKYVR